jgi:hypothetical protein
MPQRIFAVLDTLVSLVITGTGLISTLLLGLIVPPSEYEELKMLLIPLIGALISSGGMIMLSPNPETRRIVIGRAVLGLFFGTITPQVCALVHPVIYTILSHPVMLLFSGGLFSMIFFAISKPFTARLYARSTAMANFAGDAIEQKLRNTVQSAVKDQIEEEVNKLPDP